MNEDSEDLAIVEGVIKIAAAFGREVIAEGVETIEQGVLLMHLGCRLVQGYAIARPMSAEGLPHWVANWTVEPSWQNMSGLNLQREDLPLVTAESFLRQWVAQVIACIMAAPGELPLPANRKTCHFGRWLTGYGLAHYAHLEEFHRVESLHARLHDLAEQVLAQHVSDPISARTRGDEIGVLRDQLIEAINDVIATLV